MHTFTVDDVKLNGRFVALPSQAFWEDTFTVTKRDPKSWTTTKHSTGEKILGCSSGSYIPTPGNPFLNAVAMAYNHHHPLSLSPDAAWATIAQGLSIWINENSEKVRKQFVDFEGKVKIVIEVPPVPDWNHTLGVFSEKLQDYIGKKRNLFIADFSTSTIHDKAASEVVLMYAMSKYFDYGMRTMCGFPRITLEGSVEDWEKIRDRVRVFSEFGFASKDEHLQTWVASLTPVLDSIVESAKGNVDKSFWRSFYKEDGGSGGPYISGAVINFFPYLNDTRKWVKNTYLAASDSKKGWGLSPSSFDRGISKVDLEWDFLGQKRNVEFHGGLIGVSMSEDHTLRPECGWAVVDVTEAVAQEK